MASRLLSINVIESDSDDNDYNPENEEQMATDDDSGSENESENEAEMRDDSRHNRPSASGNHRLGFDDYMRGKPFMTMGKVRRYLVNTYSGRVSRKAVAALIGVIQHLMTHLIMESEAKMRSAKQRRISERIISMAIQGNTELSHLLANVNIPKSGVYGIIGHQPAPIA